jgi:hypothetical protein
MSSLVISMPTFHRVPRRYAPILFSLVLSTAITAVTSGLITAINTGFDAGYPERWMRAWALAWAFAFPTVTLFGPSIRRMIERLTEA